MVACCQLRTFRLGIPELAEQELRRALQKMGSKASTQLLLLRAGKFTAIPIITGFLPRPKNLAYRLVSIRRLNHIGQRQPDLAT